MTPRRDFCELTTLLAAVQDAYRTLLELSRGQKKAFEAGGARFLMRIIAKKQAMIDRLGGLDELLSPYTRQWQATISALPEPARRQVAGLVAEMSTLVHDLVESEHDIERILAVARAETAARLRGVSGGRTAAAAYGGPAPAASGRFLDREE